MRHWGPLVAALFAAIVILSGLAFTTYKGVVVAPHAHNAADGRLHHHLKNVTRFGGTPEEVAGAIARAVYLQGADVSPLVDWREAIGSAVAIRPPVRHLVALAAEGADAAAWALPGAFWAVYAGAPVVFVGRDGPTADGAERLRRYRGVPIYLLAPAERVSEAGRSALGRFGPVQRVAADTLAAHAVRIAEFRDEGSGFGWGRRHDREEGYFHYVVAAPQEADHALAALPLAQTNAATFLFAGRDGGVPAATDRYLWGQRAAFFTTPSEGPFRHFWIVGNRVSYAAQARIDWSVEKSPYPTLGSVALGPMEALALVFIGLGLAGGIFVWVHAGRLLPELMFPMRIAWTGTAALFPVGGILLYFAAYRRHASTDGHMSHWWRPPAVVAAAATAMSFGYGAPLMVAIGYLFVFFGFPIYFGEWADGWWFLFGAGMPLMMAAMYLGAVLIAWPLVQVTMKSMWMGVPPKKVLGSALGTTALSMAAVSLGMMSVAWWMMMAKLPMMPAEDEVMWFGALWLASTIGFLVAWPFNWVMVRAQLKPGVT